VEPAGEKPVERSEPDRGEVAAHVERRPKSKVAGRCQISEHRPLGPPTGAAGMALIQKAPLVRGVDLLQESRVDDPVAEIGGCNQARLWVVGGAQEPGQVDERAPLRPGRTPPTQSRGRTNPSTNPRHFRACRGGPKRWAASCRPVAAERLRSQHTRRSRQGASGHHRTTRRPGCRPVPHFPISPRWAGAIRSA